MKRFQLSLFFIVLFHLANAQRFYTLGDDKNYVDSLTLLIKESKSDSIRCLNFFKLSDLFRRNKNLYLASDYLNAANAIAPKFQFLSDLSCYYNAANHLKQGDYEEYGRQLILANEKLKKYNNITAYSFRAFILKNIAALEQMKNNEKGALRILIHEAMPLAEKSGDFEIMSALYNNLGIIFMNNDDRGKAFNYLTLAINYAERSKTPSPTLLESKLHAYINNAENSTQLNKLSNAKESLDKAFQVLKNYPESNLNAIFYQARGLHQHGLAEFKEAITSYNLGIKNCELNADKVTLNNLKFIKSQSLNKLERYAEARDLLIEIVENYSQNADDAKMCYNQIIINCEKVGDIKNGYKYSKKYMALTDSLYKTNSKKEIVELEAKYNTAEKEKRINQLEAQKQQAILTSEKNQLNNILFGVFSFVLLLIISFLWKYYHDQKKLSAEKEKNYTQNLTALKNQKEIELMQATISGEEQERKRIARDLHDGIGSRLSSLKMRLIHMSKNTRETEVKEMEVFTALLNDSINDLRQVAYNLVPETLLKLGLEEALRDLCHTLKTDAVSINFHASEIKKTISESNQITLFRIVQELINNALKHSECTEIIVDCSQNEHLFLITVEDNGIGFKKEELESFSGLGFKNIKNRIDLLNGKLEIETSLNNGTIFNIELNV